MASENKTKQNNLFKLVFLKSSLLSREKKITFCGGRQNGNFRYAKVLPGNNFDASAN